MALDKAALLDAIAKGGSAAGKAYETAQAQVAAQQQEAVRLALASTIAGNAPTGYQDQLSGIISSPYQSRSTQLASQNATSQDWFARLGASAGRWGDVMSGLQDAVTARALAEGSSGGGSGKDGKDPEIDDWYDNLKNTFGTPELAKSGIQGEADRLNLNKWSETGMSPHGATAKFAEEQYGVPGGIAADWYPQPKADQEFEALAAEKYKKVTGKGKGFRRQLRATAKSVPGNQKYITSRYKTKVTPKKKKK